MEYNRNFQDNIYKEEFNSRIKGINKWIEENKELYDWARDPNAYEMTNVFLFAGKYSQKGEDIDLAEVEKMWNLRFRDFENCNISQNNFVYRICEQAYECAISKKALVDDEASHSALRKMAGIGIYLMQQQRDTGDISYNNIGEFTNLLEDASVLKQEHFKLYSDLKFEENLRVIKDLQIRNLGENEKEELLEIYEKTVGKDELEDIDIEDGDSR